MKPQKKGIDGAIRKWVNIKRNRKRGYFFGYWANFCPLCYVVMNRGKKYGELDEFPYCYDADGECPIRDDSSVSCCREVAQFEENYSLENAQAIITKLRNLRKEFAKKK